MPLALEAACGRSEKRRIPLNNEAQNSAEFSDQIALRRAQSSMDIALAALQRDPKQISIQYETDKLSFDWRKQFSDLEAEQSNLQFLVKEYVSTENLATAKKPAVEKPAGSTPFNVTA